MTVDPLLEMLICCYYRQINGPRVKLSGKEAAFDLLRKRFALYNEERCGQSNVNVSWGRYLLRGLYASVALGKAALEVANTRFFLASAEAIKAALGVPHQKGKKNETYYFDIGLR